MTGKGSDVRRYDPLEPPEPEEWLALDEAERIRLAERYHRRARIRVPSTKAHAAMHVVVEAREPETQRIEDYYAALRRLTADYWRHSG
jgi:hypothetical protein